MYWCVLLKNVDNSTAVEEAIEYGHTALADLLKSHELGLSDPIDEISTLMTCGSYDYDYYDEDSTRKDDIYIHKLINAVFIIIIVNFFITLIIVSHIDCVKPSKGGNLKYSILLIHSFLYKLFHSQSKCCLKSNLRILLEVY